MSWHGLVIRGQGCFLRIIPRQGQIISTRHCRGDVSILIQCNKCMGNIVLNGTISVGFTGICEWTSSKTNIVLYRMFPWINIKDASEYTEYNNLMNTRCQLSSLTWAYKVPFQQQLHLLHSNTLLGLQCCKSNTSN